MQTRTMILPYFGKAKVTFSGDRDAAAYDALKRTKPINVFTMEHEGFYVATSARTGASYSVRYMKRYDAWQAFCESDDTMLTRSVGSQRAAESVCRDYDADLFG